MPSASRIIAWFVISILYLSIIVSTIGIALIFLGAIMAVAYWAYTIDQEREKSSTDDFKDDNLFFRHGQRINRTVFSIPVDTNWSDAEVLSFASSMREELINRTSDKLGTSGNVFTESIEIHDRKKTSDSKTFLKMSFKTVRGSKLTHFVHYAVVGKSIVAHYFTYVQGTYEWDDVVNHILVSPMSIWFWGIAWYVNRHSIISAMSKNIENSFDVMDLSTYNQASYFVLMDETRAFLKENNLLSDELAQVIFNNINNSQNISVNGSSGISLGNVTHAVQGAVKNIGVGSASQQ